LHIVKFIDNRFQELRLAEAAESQNQTYSITRDSETLALQSVLKALRVITKWAYIPKVLAHYALTLLKLLPDPQPVMLEKIKKDQESQKLATKAVSKLEAVRENKTTQ